MWINCIAVSVTLSTALQRRRESAAIPSPVHLSWLALQAYNDFFPDDAVSEEVYKKRISLMLGLVVNLVCYTLPILG